MNEKTLGYIQFIKENHKDWLGKMNGALIAKTLGISQGRVSQLIKAMGSDSVAVEFSDRSEIVQGPAEVAQAAEA